MRRTHQKRFRSLPVWAGALFALLASFTMTESALAGITLKSTVTNYNRDESTLVVPRPEGVVAGDFLLAQITFEKGLDIAIAEVPEGWTQVLRTDQKTEIGQAIYYKFATDEDLASYTYTWSFGKHDKPWEAEKVDAIGGILAYSGVDPDRPICASGGSPGESKDTDPALTAPGIDAGDCAKLVAFFGIKEVAKLTPLQSAMVWRYEGYNPVVQDFTIMAADEDLASGGQTGDRSASSYELDESPAKIVVDHWVAQLVALRAADAPVPTQPSALVLLIDEDSIDNGIGPNFFSAIDVNDDIAGIGQREQLDYFKNHLGQYIWLYTGQVGDEGWFALTTIPDSWAAAGLTSDGLTNYLTAGPGLGSGGDPEALLDKIPDVTPLHAAGIESLMGQQVCAVVYDSDISINYDPLNGSLKGATLGTVAFKVLSVEPREGASSSSLPKVEIQILDADQICP